MVVHNLFCLKVKKRVEVKVNFEEEEEVEEEEEDALCVLGVIHDCLKLQT